MKDRAEKIQILVDEYEKFLNEKSNDDIQQIFESNDFVLRKENDERIFKNV